MNRLSLERYIEGIQSQNRGVLAKAISLIESQKKQDMELAALLLSELMEYDGKSKRIGITGLPGAGKSTFINSLGMELASHSKIAVLSVDPSSSLTGGSILGDKTRMQDLSFHENAFVRPSPSLGYLGGVGARTRESILLCEAAGFDYVILESVGVGQSEQALIHMVDLCILLQLTGGGDELQGIKRGLLETCDWVLIHKADGENEVLADKVKHDFQSAMGILRSKEESIWVESISSVTKKNYPELLKQMDKFFQAKSRLQEKRILQQIHWLDHLIEQEVLYHFRSNQALQDQIQKVKQALLKEPEKVWEYFLKIKKEMTS